MKRLLNVGLITVLMLFVVQNTPAQTDDSAIKANLTSLFNHSKAKAFEKAAELIVYEGEDKARDQKDSFNSSNKDEVNQVKRICKKISALIELSSKYDFGPVVSKQVDGKDIYSIDVNFISGDQKLATGFTFLKTAKGFLLSNMN
jgi:hypothetical protein